LCFARNSATSASTAWVSSTRAPLRRISVRESVKAPGWASLMTLLSDTAYHSFIGEVEALNTTTIRRLTRSRRHQLLAIAHGDLADSAIASKVETGRALIEAGLHPATGGSGIEASSGDMLLESAGCLCRGHLKGGGDGDRFPSTRRLGQR